VQIKYEAKFEKDLKKIQDTNFLKRLKKLINIIKKSNSTIDIPQIKKLKGHDSFYRIKIGDYRIGFELLNEELILTRILHRKTIYRYFP
jgi:mRNA interferase RelE/StbE